MTFNSELFHQASSYPIESSEKIDEFINLVRQQISWDRVGILMDEDNKNLVFLLLSSSYMASFRLNLPIAQILVTLSNLTDEDTIIEMRCYQGSEIVESQLASSASLLALWKECVSQSSVISDSELVGALEGAISTGRNRQFTRETITKVMTDSHGHCMFVGCGEPLNLDDLSGWNGNFSYNAHIVASSEAGPRGIPFLSERLSNDPNNVMLLCDKHHRLIDRIARANYTASKLSQMRINYIETVSRLLEGLSFQPVPVYTVLWPVGNYRSAIPEMREIAACLAKIGSRILGNRNDVCGSDSYFIKSPDRFSQNIDEIIRDAAEDILLQTKQYGYRAALFAFGPMPALVGLGALLGSKGQFTPMLRFRDGNCWVWPSDTQVDCPYDYVIKGGLEDGKEVTLTIALTNYPNSLNEKALELGFTNLVVSAKSMGNAAIPHPNNGNELRAFVHKLLLNLKDEFNVPRVHLLICASNAACVYVGQAYDLYQPELLVYDFDSNVGLVPRLCISTEAKKVQIQTAANITKI